jgi:polysaccharide biosynthesis transport protein
MDLIYFFKVLYRRKWIIIGLSFLAVVTAFVYLFFKPELYKSEAQYSTGFTAEKVRLLDGTSGIDIFTAEVKFNNAIETFKSPKVINAIAYKLMLHDLQFPDEAYRQLSKKKKESAIYKAVNKDTAIYKLTEAIQNNKLLSSITEQDRILIEFLKLYGYDYENMLAYLIIERLNRTDYLNMTYWSENPNLSALIVNAMGQEFLNYYKNLNSRRSEENAMGIKKVLVSQQEKIDSLGKKLYSEKVKQGSIDPVSLSTSAMETVKELETSLAQEKSKQNEHYNRRKYLVERLNNLQANSSSSPGVNSDEIIRLTNRKNALVAELAGKGGRDAALEKQIDDLRSEISSKNSMLSSRNNSSVKTKEIEDLKIQISEEEALLNAANSTIADYTNRISKYTGLANSAAVGSDVTISGIKTRLEMENAQLGIVMEKYAQAEGLVKDDPTANFIQTAVGQPAVAPESKKTLLTMLLSGASVFFLSAVIFLLLEIFDPRVKTPTIFSKHVQLNLVNILNTVPLKNKSEQEIIFSDVEGKKFARENLYKNNIRKLRFELLNNPEKVYLFTSTQKGTGKTTTIEALAASLLLSKKKVLIIDMNFANNQLTQTHHPQYLIQDVGNKITSYELPVKNQVAWSPTEQPGLFIIGCQQGNFTPSEALANLDMKAFLQMLKAEFDFILIEGAALNDYADSQEITEYAEAVFTVFSGDSIITKADEKSLKFISSLDEKNKGTILNNVLKENINF